LSAYYVECVKLNTNDSYRDKKIADCGGNIRVVMVNGLTFWPKILGCVVLIWQNFDVCYKIEFFYGIVKCGLSSGS